MPSLFQATADLVKKAYVLARPFGRKKLAAVTAVSLAQGFFQVVGVTSIFPFLAVASDPAKLRESPVGTLLSHLPEMDDRQLLFVAGIFAVIMLLVANGVNLLAEFVRTRYAHNFGHWLRCRLLRKIASRPYGDFLQENSGVLVKKVVGDVMSFTTGVLLPLLDSMARLATIVLLVTTLIWIHPTIALFATLGLGVFYLFVFRFFGSWRKTATEKLLAAGRGTYIESQQMLGGIKPVKVHGCEKSFIDRFTIHSAIQARFLARVGVLTNGPRYLVEPLAFGGIVIVALVYSSRGEELAAILPDLCVMALAGYRLLPAIQLLYGQLTSLTTMRHSLDEVYEEFRTAEKTIENFVTTKPTPIRWDSAITLKNLSFSYPGNRQPTIEGLSLSIPKYSSLGIIGTTGCGKSTLVDLLLGLHLPTSGSIFVDETPLTPENHAAWRSDIGYVPQEVFLIDDTLAANIAFGVPKNQIDSAALTRAASAAQIATFIENELPDHYETLVGERGVRLSGGQRQRIGLARALYHAPGLLILDEATSALDSTTESEVLKAIDSLHGKITIIIIAHRLMTVEKCTQILDLATKTRGTPSAALAGTPE